MQDVTPNRNSNVQILDNKIIPQSASLHRSTSYEVENVMTVRDIFSVIARRKLLLLSMVLLTLALSLYYTFSVKPSYRANAILQIEREGAQIVNFGQTRKASEVFDNDPFFKTRYEILKSRVVAQRVIDELNLIDSLENKDNKNPYSFAAITGLFQNIFSKNKQPKHSVDHVSLFQKKLRVQPIPGTQLVEVYYEAFSPDEARDVIASLLKNFIKLQIETVSDTDEYAKEFLGKQLISSRDKLNKSEDALIQFANINGILKVDDKQSRHIKKLENLDDALVKAELNRIETESLFLQMDRTGSISRISTNPILLNLKARLFQTESDYQKKLQSLKANHPDMQSLKKLITSTKSKINKELENIKTSIEADFLTTQRQEQRIREELSQFKQEMHQLQNKNLEYSALKRDVETNEKIYNNLLQRLEEVNVASAANTSNISIIEPPITPLARYRPNTKLNTLIGLFSGLVLGLGLVFLRESFDQSIKSHEDLEKKSGLPVLGRIPSVTRRNRSQLDMIVSKAPNDPISEAYRILSANIQLLVSRSAERIIMITSAHSGDGKSITASNVACAFAQSGKRVLLIDADIRRPSLHKILDLKNEAGLSNYLKGETDFGGITQPVSEVYGLYVITGGVINSDPVSLLSNDRMEFLANQGAKAFDYVIIDAPPVIGFADTLLLTSIATSTLIVANDKSLDNRMVKTMLEKLARIKNNLLGFLLVNVKNPEARDNFYLDYPEKPVTQLLLKSD